MIRPRAYRRLVAWLACAALWLVVAAPVVSRVLAGPSAAAAMAMHCGESGDHGAHPGSPDPLAPSADACGYCGLLGHSPVLGSVPWLPTVAMVWPAPLEIVVAVPRAVGLRVLAAAPRGPPVRSDA